MLISAVSSGSHLSPHFTSIKTTKERTNYHILLFRWTIQSSLFLTALCSYCNTHEGLTGYTRMLKHHPSSSLSISWWFKTKFGQQVIPPPPHWNEALVLPFLKPNKSGTHPQDYHLITLTSCLCMLLEQMVNSRLMWYLESNNLSPQFGFQRAKSTADPLAHFETYPHLHAMNPS